MIMPDSGNEIKTGSFNSQFVLFFFGVLVVMFFVCLFFIIGYHIKLSQEKSYKNTMNTHKRLLAKLQKSEQEYKNLSDRITKIQRNDSAFRLIAAMKVIDGDMYKAGIGGHTFVDKAGFDLLNDDLKVKLEDLSTGVVTLTNRVKLEDKSLGEIRSGFEKNFDVINNRPTIFPTCGYARPTSGFGSRINPITFRSQFHSAVDLAGHRGQPILATADGVVISAEYSGRLGRCIEIRHKYGYQTLYAHLDKINVEIGQKVKKGDTIGAMGATGSTTGVHLHYGVSLNGVPENPVKYFKR